MKEHQLVFLIEKFNDNNGLEIHCIDTWEGGVEHSNVDMSLVEKRFNSNTQIAYNYLTIM
jgi:hypothetical protein